MSSRIIDKNKQQLRILLAEDDQFQRLSLIDVLSLCSFEVTAVENGVFARDELLKDEQNYDLVLLDLKMPQLDGLQLLQIMKSQEKLKEIPVIMMSSDSEMEIVALCMEKGAADYIIKPIRIQNVKDFKKHINTDTKKTQTKPLTDQYNYEKLRLLGRGAAGSVELVRRSHDDQLFALKTIQMHFMNPAERKLAENEITLLKVLKGPTIIRYYDSFIENDSIHIVMEYAEGGALNDKISEYKCQGKQISKNQIFTWIAHIVLGIMNMHSKNILHRDIKTQNMFITKDNIIKLGDFGIAKALGTQVDFAKTFLGTPYFMSPEVCKGHQYGQKADIWAIGCVVYELVTFKRPFNHDQLAGVFNIIINQQYTPLPPETDPDIVSLIDLMLQKDPDLRPNIFKLMEIDIIKQYVNEFLKQQEGGSDILESYMVKKANNPTVQQIDIKEEDTNSAIQSNDLIITLYPMLKEQLDFQSFKTGYFTYQHQLFKGQNLYEIIQKQPNISNHLDFCQKLIDQRIIVLKIHNNNVVQPKSSVAQTFHQSNDSYYTMNEFLKKIQNFSSIQTTEIASKMIIPSIFEQIQNIINVINLQMDSVGSFTIESIEKNFKLFEEQISQLQLVEIPPEKSSHAPFFLNLLQIMQFHQAVLMNSDDQEQSSTFRYYFDIISSFFHNKKDFNYMVDKKIISINEIINGILKGNKSIKGQKVLQHEWAEYAVPFDQRFLLFNVKKCTISQTITQFNEIDFEQQFEQYTSKIIQLYVVFDEIENELILPQYFQEFLKEISQEKLVKWVVKYMIKVKKNVIIDALNQDTLIINFQAEIENK